MLEYVNNQYVNIFLEINIYFYYNYLFIRTVIIIYI
jgi:hypothetical protein